MMHDRQLIDRDPRVRMGWAESLCFALGECHPDDASAICAAFLESQAAGMPGCDPWGDIRADAAFWTDSAHVAEVEIYTCAGLHKLGRMALAKTARKKLFRALWRSFTSAEQAAFIKAASRGAN